MEITTEHRQEAKLAAAKGAMSEKAAARLREIGEDEKQRKAANRVFHSQFSELASGTYEHLLSRMSHDQAFLPRRAEKLCWALSHGWTPTPDEAAHDVLFLAELTREEQAMTDAQFSNHLETSWVYETKITPVKERRCALGKDCFKYENRKAGLVTGSSLFCSRACSTSRKAKKQVPGLLPTAQESGSSSLAPA